MTTSTRTLAEVLRDGHRALINELGPADMIRFIQSYSPGSGDYVKERDVLLGNDDVRTIAERIRKRQQQRSAK